MKLLTLTGALWIIYIHTEAECGRYICGQLGSVVYEAVFCEQNGARGFIAIP